MLGEPRTGLPQQQARLLDIASRIFDERLSVVRRGAVTTLIGEP